MLHPKHIVLTDIDNTLYDWPKFFAPSFRAMCHALARNLGVSFDTLLEDFKLVYGHHDSLEYAFSIQELSSVNGLDKKEIDNLVRIGRGAFSRVQKFHLQPYPSVVEGLEYLSKHGHIVICVTNSPLYLAQKRLYELKLDQFITGIIAWEGIKVPDSINTNFVSRAKRKKTRILLIDTFSKSESKPNTKPYELALNLLGDHCGPVWVIGDSINKDLLPASKLGIRTIWAKYGANFDPTNKDNKTLLRITNWSDDEVANTYDENSFQPDYQVDSFSEFCQLLPKRNPTLLDLMEQENERS